jgi:hypothetical protein
LFGCTTDEMMGVVDCFHLDKPNESMGSSVTTFLSSMSC